MVARCGRHKAPHSQTLRPMLDARWYTYESEGLRLLAHPDRFSALRHAEAVVRADPKQLVQILVLEGIVSMPSKQITGLLSGSINHRRLEFVKRASINK